MFGVVGVTAIETSPAGETVSTVEPVTPAAVALIDEVPVATPVARPVALIVATEVVAETQVTLLVRFCVELSLNVPVAVNCSVVPLAMLGLAGATAIETSAAGETVSTVDPATPESVALIIDVPFAMPVAKPVLLIVATEVVAE